MTHGRFASLRSLPHRGALVVAAAILFVENLFYVGILPLLPVFADKYELSSVGVGVIVGAYAAGVIVGSASASILGRILGFRRLAALGLLILAVATVGFALIEQIALLNAFRFCQGVGAGLAWVGVLGWTAVLAPPERKGLVIGLVMSTAVIGAVLGPVVGALAVQASIEVVFGTLAIIQATLGFCVLAMTEPEGGVATPEESRARPTFRASCIALSLVGLPAMLAGIYEALTPLALDRAGASTSVIAGIFVIGAAGEAIAGPLAGRYSDTAGRLVPVCVALAIAPPTCLVLTITEDRFALIIVSVFAWLAITSAWTPGLALVADLSETGSGTARDWAQLNVVLAAGVLAGSVGGPALGMAVEPWFPFAVAGLGCAIAIGAAVRYRKELTLTVITNR